MSSGPQNPYDPGPAGDPEGRPAGQNPYEPTQPYQAAPPPYGQAQPGPAGQPVPPPYTSPYGQPQPGYQQPYGHPYQPVVPPHPSANTSLVLGIVGLAGILLCGGLTLVLSPFAWLSGSRAVREIDQAPPGTYAGRETANSGRIMGIIGTGLLALGILAAVGFVVLAIVLSTSSTTY